MLIDIRDEREVIRITATKEVRKRLEGLVERRGGRNIAEVLRRALSFYEECIDLEENGGSVLMKSGEGDPVAVVARKPIGA